MFVPLFDVEKIVPHKPVNVNNLDYEYINNIQPEKTNIRLGLTSSIIKDIILSMNMTTTNSDLLTTLQGIGLTNKEALTYLACLELGPSSIWDIAKKSGVKRTSCYVIMDELMLKGYASHITDGKRTIYSAVAPSQLFRAVEQRHERFVRSMSQLEAVASQAPSKPRLTMYEGSAGIREAYGLSLGLPKGSEILTYGTGEVETSYPELIGEYLADRIAKKIRVRALLPRTELNISIASRDEAELRETRFLPAEQFPQKTEMNCFGENIVYIAHSEKEPFATVLSSSTLAAEERARFEILWGVSSGA